MCVCVCVCVCVCACVCVCVKMACSLLGRVPACEQPAFRVCEPGSQAALDTLPEDWHAGGRKDYYDILQIPRSADDSQIKRAYRKLALQYHPVRLLLHFVPNASRRAHAL